jgi:hypothetical protein
MFELEIFSQQFRDFTSRSQNAPISLLVLLVKPARLCSAATVTHVAPAPALPAALIEKKPAAVTAIAHTNSPRFGRTEKRECFGSEQGAQLFGRQTWSWPPLTADFAKFNFRPTSIGPLAKQININFGKRARSNHRQSDAVDGLTKLNDSVQRLWIFEQFEIGVRSDQPNLRPPS